MFQESMSTTARLARFAFAVPSLLLTCAWFGSPLAAQVCNENLFDNHVGAQSIAVPGFVPGEEGAAVFQAPAAHYPIEILRIQIHWGSQLGGAPQSLEGALKIYEGAPPAPTPIFNLPGPVLTDGAINEFDISLIPGDKIIDSGPFTVSLSFLNASTLFGPSMVIDGAGCIPGQNYVFAIPGGWSDLCSFGASGNWKLSVVYCSVAPPIGDSFLRGDANLDLLFNIADPIRALDALFGAPPTALDCPDAGDANDDGALNIADAIFMLGAIFSGGNPPLAPGPLVCGPDPTPDPLDCPILPACP